jgi:hypothetical protein
MSYIGSTPTTQSFISGTDYFNGTGSQTAFTLSRNVASVNDVEAVVNNVVQRPNDAYNISGTTITFTSAPSSGTSNIYVRYLSTTTQSITPSQNTVSYATWNSDLRNETWAFRNRIINGDMTIDQRNNGASQSVSASTYPYTVDRFWIACGGSSAAFTVQQNQGSVTPPTGFSNYVGITVATSKSPASGDEFTYEQPIEGNNVADLAFGTNGASTVTFSFWVRSSLTGTFSGYLLNSARNRSYIFNYTISAANTWEYKTVTIAGDTTGTWLRTTGAGLRIGFDLGSGSNYQTTANTWGTADARRTSGSVQLIANSAATLYITGVQLEKGFTATNFDVLPYGTELFLCQRYFYKFGNTAGAEIMPITAGCWGSSGRCSIYLGVPMRAAPTVSLSGTAAGSFFLTNANDSAYINFSYTGGGSFQSGVNTSPYINYTADAASGIGSLYIQANRVLSVNAEL